EWTNRGVDEVVVNRSVTKGANIRRRGDDMREGETILRAGTRLGASEIALLAGVRKTSVSVSRRPTVAILSTGDELIDVHAQPADGRIVNTNAPMLAELVREMGGTAIEMGIVPDQRDATIAALESALHA